MNLRSRSIRVNGEMIRNFRLDRGWTQEDLARLSGYTSRLIRKAESGGAIDIVTVQNIVEALSTAGACVTFQMLASKTCTTVDEHTL